MANGLAGRAANPFWRPRNQAATFEEVMTAIAALETKLNGR